MIGYNIEGEDDDNVKLTIMGSSFCNHMLSICTMWGDIGEKKRKAREAVVMVGI